MVIHNDLINNLIEKCYKSNIIKEGQFTLKSGQLSKYYFDFKNLVAYPILIKEIGDLLYSKISSLNLDDYYLASIAIGGIPISSYISVNYNIPMVIIRGEKKEYGTQKQIEGDFVKGSKCILIDDVMTTGGSIKDALEILETELEVIQIYTIMDRQQTSNNFFLNNNNYTINSILNKTDITKYKLNKILNEKKNKLCLSLDIENQDHFFGILDKIGENIVTVKIHSDIIVGDFHKFQKKLINYSIEKNFLIMEDRKFVDISYITSKQYNKFSNWVDMVTVMGNVNSDVIMGMSGTILVNDMSNNDFDYTDRVSNNLEDNEIFKRVIGIVSQTRFPNINMYTMTPGINKTLNRVGDQQYRTITNVDADLYIVGRGIYEGNPEENIKLYLRDN